MYMDQYGRPLEKQPEVTMPLELFVRDRDELIRRACQNESELARLTEYEKGRWRERYEVEKKRADQLDDTLTKTRQELYEVRRQIEDAAKKPELPTSTKGKKK